MATNKPFDVRIVNPLERPTSNDFNLAQSVARGSVESLANAVFNLSNAGHSGFIGSAFLTRRQPVVANMTVFLTSGLGFQQTTTEAFTDLDGIAGVSDVTGRHMLPLYLSSPLTIAVPAAPTNSTKCRRDLIAVKALAAVTDQSTSDRFNPTSQVFAPYSFSKTVTWDLVDYTPQVLTTGQTPTTDQPVVYVRGDEADYVNADSFATAAISPAVPEGYLPVAYINVPPNITAITTDLIIDARRLLFANDTGTLSFKLTGGAGLDADLNFVAGLALALNRAIYPPGMKFDPAVSKLTKLPLVPGRIDRNAFRITIPIAGIEAYEATAMAAIQNLVIDNTINEPVWPYMRACHAIVSTVTPTLLTTALIDDLMNPDVTVNPPSSQPAVGQPVLQVEITLCAETLFAIGGQDYPVLDPTATKFGEFSNGFDLRVVGMTCTVQLKQAD